MKMDKSTDNIEIMANARDHNKSPLDKLIYASNLISNTAGESRALLIPNNIKTILKDLNKFHGMNDVSDYFSSDLFTLSPLYSIVTSF